MLGWEGSECLSALLILGFVFVIFAFLFLLLLQPYVKYIRHLLECQVLQENITICNTLQSNNLGILQKINKNSLIFFAFLTIELLSKIGHFLHNICYITSQILTEKT